MNRSTSPLLPTTATRSRTHWDNRRPQKIPSSHLVLEFSASSDTVAQFKKPGLPWPPFLLLLRSSELLSHASLSFLDSVPSMFIFLGFVHQLPLFLPCCFPWWAHMGPWLQLSYVCCHLLFFALFFIFWDSVSCSPGWLQTSYVAEIDLELLILLLPLPKCQGYSVSVAPSFHAAEAQTQGFTHVSQTLY